MSGSTLSPIPVPKILGNQVLPPQEGPSLPEPLTPMPTLTSGSPLPASSLSRRFARASHTHILALHSPASAPCRYTWSRIPCADSAFWTFCSQNCDPHGPRAAAAVHTQRSSSCSSNSPRPPPRSYFLSSQLPHQVWLGTCTWESGGVGGKGRDSIAIQSMLWANLEERLIVPSSPESNPSELRNASPGPLPHPSPSVFTHLLKVQANSSPPACNHGAHRCQHSSECWGLQKECRFPPPLGPSGAEETRLVHIKPPEKGEGAKSGGTHGEEGLSSYRPLIGTNGMCLCRHCRMYLCRMYSLIGKNERKKWCER